MSSEAKYGAVGEEEELQRNKKQSCGERWEQNMADFRYLLMHKGENDGRTYFCYKTPGNWIEYMIFLIIGWAVAIGVWVGFFFISMAEYYAPYYYGIVFLGLCVVLLIVIWMGHNERVQREQELATIRNDELKKFGQHH